MLPSEIGGTVRVGWWDLVKENMQKFAAGMTQNILKHYADLPLSRWRNNFNKSIQFERKCNELAKSWGNQYVDMHKGYVYTYYIYYTYRQKKWKWRNKNKRRLF